ncbi:MAG: HNH endonuclease family protein [Alkalibacterium sp.]|nr:HNH endonuclease family protein [Alkalibacterium sp.]
MLLDEETIEPTDDLISEEDDTDSFDDDSVVNVSELAPQEIRAYVNSLKEISQYWFLTYFPEKSDLSSEENLWLERLNRIGIGYFRPIVTLSLLPEMNITEDERLSLYTAIERFIFICFKMGTFQSSYKSSYYYRKGKDLYYGETNIHDIIRSLNETVSEDLNTALSNFTAKMATRFSKHDGFYSWRDLRYVLFEYEHEKAENTGIQKIDWESYANLEKDRLSIEHILPQSPTKWYWKNQFRPFTEKEIKSLSGSLGNLLPLSQSISPAMQNEAFPDKKAGQTPGRRGYRNGSHSEIEVSTKEEWSADAILERGMNLLAFMEKRWDFSFENEQQMLDLLHIEFVTEDREDVPEIPEEITLPLDDEDTIDS